jgi:hypothetical protein
MISKRTYLAIPLASRSNRRWLVLAYCGIVLLVAAAAAIWFHFVANQTVRPQIGFIQAICTGLCVGWLFTALGGMGREGPVSSFESASPNWKELWRTARGWHARGELGQKAALDERDIRLCNAAHYEAYKVVRFNALLVPVLIVLFGTILRKQIWLAPSIGLVLLLVVFNLPQTFILWWELDMKEDPEA